MVASGQLQSLPVPLSDRLLKGRDIAPFSFWCRIAKAGISADGEWEIEGPASEPSTDWQGERMAQGRWGVSGVRKALAGFMRLGGLVDWEHRYETTRDGTANVGKCVQVWDAAHPITGVIVPWIKVRLFKNMPQAQTVWQLVQANVPLGFSVAGAALRKAANQILDLLITTIGVTALPVQTKNAGCIRVAKSITALADYHGRLEGVLLPQAGAAGRAWAAYARRLAKQRPAATRLLVPAVGKALSMTGSLPAAGPGIDAASVEDLGATGEVPDYAASLKQAIEQRRRARRRARRRVPIANATGMMRKALTYHIGEALAERLA
jgi:hypothetical protein